MTMARATILAAALFLGACTGNGLPVEGETKAATVSFDACRPCHAQPSPMNSLFDPSQPEDFRSEVRKMLTEEKSAHPFQPDQEQWNALMIWSDQT
jgi:hypothetical protein